MHGAGAGFSEHGRLGLEAIHRENLPVIGARVLGKETGPVDAHALGVGAPNQLAGEAVRTVAAVNVRVDRHALPGAEATDLTPDLHDLTDRLVTRGERIDADVGPVVQVQVRAADAGLV